MIKVSHDSETPAHGQQVITACAFIYREFDGVVKVFLPKRAATKKFLPDIYELPGGHIEFGEELIDGLKREIFEEFKMKVSIGDPFAAFTYKNEIKGAHAVEVVYFAKFAEPLNSIMLNPEDHSSFEWFSEKDTIARRKEIVPTEHVSHTFSDDPEYLAILRGFELLRGELLDVG